MYSHFDENNEINGSILMFGAAVGQKRIYPILNPSEENKFQ